jgi:hypothetical protein
MKFMIGVPTGNYARKAQFYDFFDVMSKPSNCVILRPHGQSPAKSRNIIIQQALETDCSHIIFFDDDMALPADTAIKLIENCDRDAVTGLYFGRNFPHQPIIFDEILPDGLAKYHFMEDGEQGLIKVTNAGLGCCMIKTDVFRAMEKPWIRLGELSQEDWCDDIGFFNRFYAAGFELWCDLSILCGHIADVTIWPYYVDGKWYTTYDTYGPARVTIPAVHP